jgi:hypothetical protein
MSGTPRGRDYQVALQNPRTRFKDPRLQGAQVLTDSNGIPQVWSGGFVVTFQVTLANGQKRALRCYTQSVADLAERYDHIRLVVQAAPTLFADIAFQNQGILVDGAWYPVQEMDWIEGQPLNNWISAHGRAADLRPLVAEFDALVATLERLGVAHGDLQHGNILVDAQGHLRLIDYDGMFVPGIAQLGANNQGHRNYQHPARRHEFDANLDRFSTIVIGLALRALVADPTLWASFGQSGECLLFTQEDFLRPATSALLHRLARVPACAPYLANFRAICGGQVADVPRLADFLAATTPLAIRPLSQPVRAWSPTYPVLAAGAPNRVLLPYAGQYVEVVGQVRRVDALTTGDGKTAPYVRLRFAVAGRYDPTQPANCTVLIFQEGLAAFAAAQRDPLAWEGQWVAVQHFLETYTHPRSTTGARPQLRIVDPNAIVLLTVEQAQQRLALGGWSASAPSRNRPVSPPSLPASPPPAVKPVTPTSLTPDERRRREAQQRAQLNAQLWGQTVPVPPPVVAPAASMPAAPSTVAPPPPAVTVPASGGTPPSPVVPVAPPAPPATGPSAPGATGRWRAFWQELHARLRKAREELEKG